MPSTTATCSELSLTAPQISAPVIPPVDWRPIRGSLGAFRAGYEEIEHFISELLDEIDAAWQELEAERSRRSATDVAARHASDDRSLVPIDACGISATLLPAEDGSVGQLDANARARFGQLQHKCVALQTEVNLLRSQLASQADQFAEERRQTAQERLAWADELRQLREAIHRQMEALNLLPTNRAPNAEPRRQRNQSLYHAAQVANDPVMGPLLAQLKTLQRDADRRRKGEPSDEVSIGSQSPQASRSAEHIAPSGLSHHSQNAR